MINALTTFTKCFKLKHNEVSIFDEILFIQLKTDDQIMEYAKQSPLITQMIEAVRKRYSIERE